MQKGRFAQTFIVCALELGVLMLTVATLLALIYVLAVASISALVLPGVCGFALYYTFTTYRKKNADLIKMESANV